MENYFFWMKTVLRPTSVTKRLCQSLSGRT